MVKDLQPIAVNINSCEMEDMRRDKYINVQGLLQVY